MEFWSKREFVESFLLFLDELESYFNIILEIRFIYNRVSQPVFRGTLLFRGAIFGVPQKDKKIKKHTGSN